MFDQYFSKALELTERGIPYATATVVHAEKPTSGKPGDKALITIDGQLYGWIGGSCAQPTVISEAKTAMREDKSRFIRISNENDPASARAGLMHFPMTCYSEGALEIFIEPHLPQPQLLVIGTMPVALALMQIGEVMRYRVIGVDPEKTGTPFPHAKTVLDSLGAVIDQIRPQTFVVVASHGNYDEAALEHVLKGKPRYVGLVASRKRFDSVVEYLKNQGLTDDDLTPLKAPAGLDIQAQHADEIALSIMAEIVQLRRSKPVSLDWDALIAEMLTEKQPISQEEVASGIAIDPVCGMEVEIEKAKAYYAYEDTTYYFCCNGCKLTFSKNPEQFITRTPTIAIDPVCHMEVTIATAQYHSQHDGVTYYFCCAGCKSSFDKNPHSYLTTEQES